MKSGTITLLPYDPKYLAKMLKWFEDRQTIKYLGDKSWLDNIERALNEPMGTEFRGIKKEQYLPYVACINNEPIGFIDGGIGDRYIKYHREKDGTETYLNEVDKKSSAIAFVIAPKYRGKSYASQIIKAYTELPQLSEVGVFYAGIEPDNVASQKALEKAEFTSDYERDFEDMIYFFLWKNS